MATASGSPTRRSEREPAAGSGDGAEPTDLGARVALEPAPRRIRPGAAIVLVLVALGLAVAVGVVQSGGSRAEVTGSTTSGTVSTSGASMAPTAATVVVHVAGEVRRPGVYELSAGARVVDAIAAAGGVRDDADPTAINLAREVVDGEQLVVPREGATPEGTGTSSPSGAELVNVNQADAAGLDTLPGVGPATAAAIIAYRDDHGPFTSVDDLLAVPGIGPSTLETMRDQVTV